MMSSAVGTGVAGIAAASSVACASPMRRSSMEIPPVRCYGQIGSIGPIWLARYWSAKMNLLMEQRDLRSAGEWACPRDWRVAPLGSSGNPKSVRLARLAPGGLVLPLAAALPGREQGAVFRVPPFLARGVVKLEAILPALVPVGKRDAIGSV